MLENILQWLLENGELNLIVIILGVIIFFLYKECKSRGKLINEKEAALLSLSKEVVKLAILWEGKSDNRDKVTQGMNKLIIDIKEGMISQGFIKP